MLYRLQIFKNQRNFLRPAVAVVATIVLFSSSVAASSAAPSDVKTIQTGSTFRDCSNCPQMTVIPAGQFLMGSSDEEVKRDIEEVPENLRKSPPFMSAIMPSMLDYMAHEQPQHLVTITKSFALGTYPVTRAEFEAFIEDSGYVPESGCVIHQKKRYLKLAAANWKTPGFTQTDRDPVVCVNWLDAQAYVNWLNTKVMGNSHPDISSIHYHLPSEAEWEYAARAGTRTARPWGQEIGVNNANCDKCGSAWDERQTSPVGSFQKNSFGLYDLLGNVFEWTNDCWNSSYLNAPTNGQPWRSGNCSELVRRGGSWYSDSYVLRTSFRFQGIPDERNNETGLRVAKSIE